MFRRPVFLLEQSVLFSNSNGRKSQGRKFSGGGGFTCQKHKKAKGLESLKGVMDDPMAEKSQEVECENPVEGGR